MEGWIKIHRKMIDNPVVFKDAEYLAVWIFLLLNAAHTDYPAFFKGKKIVLHPGQLITGRKAISEKLSINESKVRRILESFENDQQIDRERSNQNSLISLTNWGKYQLSDQQNDQPMTNKRPTDDQPMTTNKKVKNEKKCRKDILLFTPPTLDEVKDYCRERGNDVEPEKFIDFYSAKGWMVGKNKMKDWKAAVRTWERNGKEFTGSNRQHDNLNMIGLPSIRERRSTLVL